MNLSICIATYNRAKFIGETLDSILPQLVADVELIVVDGASPDNTSEVMGKYLSQYPNIRYIREKENSGIDRDYDKAVTYASGEYCWLMTDDDLVKPNAIQRVLSALEEGSDLIVVNAMVLNADLSKVLQPRKMDIAIDRRYSEADNSLFFALATDYLSFIGGVVIKRDLWLSRNRADYYGTLFIHVGVIFQSPTIKNITIIAEPLITIRYGNAMWSSKGFDIWMFKWPELIWSFPDFAAELKNKVYPREPWRNLRMLLHYRAIGAYTFADYRKLRKHGATGLLGVSAFLVAIFPGIAANFLATLYLVLINRSRGTGSYDLMRSRSATWASRKLGSVFGY